MNRHQKQQIKLFKKIMHDHKLSKEDISKILRTNILSISNWLSSNPSQFRRLPNYAVEILIHRLGLCNEFKCDLSDLKI